MSRDRFWASIEKRAALNKAEENGEVIDSMDVRKALMERVHAGEITISQAQDELAKLKRQAKREGKKTRSQVWRES